MAKAQTREDMALAARAALCSDHISHLAGIPVDELDLIDYAQAAAQTLFDRHPQVIFTSGRRTVPQQADAMAGNVVQNRRWIEQTYKPSAERTQLQGWVDANPQAVTKAAIATGLRTIMQAWTAVQLGRITLHLSGQAFDVQPMSGPIGDAIQATIRGLPRLDSFLTSEGGLLIWHAQFR